MTAALRGGAGDWTAELEGNVARLERAAREPSPESADVARSRLRFLEESDIDSEDAPAREPERRIAERRAGERRVEERRTEERRSEERRSEDRQLTEDPQPDHVEIARSATEAARSATNAARLAAKAARVAIDETRIHTELARAANKTAMTALVIASDASGAMIALAVALLVAVLLVK